MLKVTNLKLRPLGFKIILELICLNIFYVSLRAGDNGR